MSRLTEHGHFIGGVVVVEEVEAEEEEASIVANFSKTKIRK